MRVRRFALGGGPDSIKILQLLDYFKKQYARSPIAREFAVSVLLANQVANNDIPRQVELLTNTVKEQLTYVADPEGSEYVISPLRLIQSIREHGAAYGDCDDHALLLNTLLSSVGIRTRFLGVKIHGADRFNHVISSALVRGQWQDIDACAKRSSQPEYPERLAI